VIRFVIHAFLYSCTLAAVTGIVVVPRNFFFRTTGEARATKAAARPVIPRRFAPV
jgi:hypothetical protein